MTSTTRTPWLTAGAVCLMATGLVAAGDAPAHTSSYALVRRGEVTATAGAAGTVQSADTRELVFGTSGTVTSVKVAPGDKVRAGALLARLDDAAAKDQVAVASAVLAAARDTYTKASEGICAGQGGRSGGGSQAGGSQGGSQVRAAGYTARPVPDPTPTPTPSPTATPTPTPTPTTPRPTRSPGPTRRPSPTGRPRHGGRPAGRHGEACAPGAVEQASAAVTQAEVKEREAGRTLDATRLTAPISGTVLSVAGTPGSQAGGPGKNGFVTLGDLTDLQVNAMFPLGEVNALTIGQHATISLGMLPGRTYAGSVTRIDPAATTSGNRALFGVMISLDDPPAGLLTGMSAGVQVVTAEAENALYVPAGAIRSRAGDTGTVLVRHGDRTTTRTVRLGVRGDRYVAVTSGLSAGERVVLPATTGADGFPDGGFPAA